MKLALKEAFIEDPKAQRRMVVPFDVLDPGKLELLSVMSDAAIELPRKRRAMHCILRFARMKKCIIASLLFMREKRFKPGI